MALIYRKPVAVVLQNLISTKVKPFWNHPAGPKTVFFWGPLFKWGLVAASFGDLSRPADELSITQSASLAVSGCIWSRYCLVITPINYSLCSVNVFVAATQFVQVLRSLRYQYSLKASRENISSQNE